MLRISLLATIMTCFSFAIVAQGAEHESIGSFDFPTSGDPAAQAHFELGVGYLHSFGFIQAQREFKLAQEIQPDFAMAYWGETFTYNHPFIGEWDAQSPMDTLERVHRGLGIPLADERVVVGECLAPVSHREIRLDLLRELELPLRLDEAEAV